MVKIFIAERPAGVPGGKAFLLVDEHGHLLPCQNAVTLKQESREVTTVTVTFSVNGEDVLIGEPGSGTVLLDKGERHGL